MHNKFEINQTKIKGGCQSGRKVVLHDFKRYLPLENQKKNSDIKKSSSTRYCQVKEQDIFYGYQQKEQKRA